MGSLAGIRKSLPPLVQFARAQGELHSQQNCESHGSARKARKAQGSLLPCAT